MLEKLYFLMLIYISVRYQNIKKHIESYDIKKDLNIIFNIFSDACYVGNTLENFGKIIFSLLIIMFKTISIIKNIMHLEFLKRYQEVSFFLLLFATALIFVIKCC